MAAESPPKKRGLFGTIIVLIVIEFAVVFLAVPTSWIKKIGEQDRSFTSTTLGVSYEKDILESASSWYLAAFIDTGVIEGVNNYLFDQWDRNAGESNIQFDDRGLSDLVKSRVNTMWSAMYIATYRVVEMWSWSVYLLPFLIPAIFDGFVRRAINKWRFFSPSPLKHHSAIMGMKFGMIIVILLPFLPIPFPVVFIPILFVFIGLMVSMFMGNLSKHI